MIPPDPSTLYDDLQQAYKLYLQAKQATRTGAIKTTGYSWDEAINPSMQLAPEDCPDGYCPREPEQQPWRPGDRVRDVLFDRVDSEKEGFFQDVSNAAIAIGLLVLLVVGCAIAGVIVLIIISRRG